MIGIDILQVERIVKLLQNETLKLCKVFTDYELEYYNAHAQNAQTLAGFFCAKESFAKALGTGVVGFGLTDIEIRHGDGGRPYLRLYNNASTLLGNRQVHLSISHTDQIAVAVCVLI